MAMNILSENVARACGNCAKAKAKCDWMGEGGRCHRCTRLNKTCTPQDAIRKRKGVKIRRAVQIANLEEKVNGLLEVIGATGQPAPAVVGPTTSSSLSGSTPSGDGDAATAPSVVVAPLSGCANHATVHPSTVKDQDALLSLFHERLAVHVPFVAVPRNLTVETLRRERPFVCMNVLMVASFEDTGTQLRLGREILEYLTERVILRGEKNFDLFQGLLIYISWYHYFLCTNHQLNNLLGILFGLLVDLGLKRVSPENETHESFVQISKNLQGQDWMGCNRQLTTDERRAFLGCYYLSSCLTSLNSRLDCLRFTPYVKDCYEFLAEAEDHGTDIRLAYLMKLQYLEEKIRISGLWESVNAHRSDTLRAPVGMLVKSYEAELHDFKASLPSESLFNPSFAMHYYSAEIHLYKIGFKMCPDAALDYGMESLQASDILYSCFLATRLFFEVFLPIPAGDYGTLPIVNTGQMFHALGTLYMLSIFDIAGWDSSNVRKTLDLSSILGQIAIKMEEAGNAYGQMELKNPWFVCVRKLRLFKSWWEMTLAHELEVAQEGLVDELQAAINFDFLDDSFWQ